MIYTKFHVLFIRQLDRDLHHFIKLKVFYSHIDNALNLVDAYTRLAKMPKNQLMNSKN